VLQTEPQMARDTHLCGLSTTLILNSGGISAGAASPARTCDDAWVGSPIRGGSGRHDPRIRRIRPSRANGAILYIPFSFEYAVPSLRLSDICHTLTRIIFSDHGVGLSGKDLVVLPTN